MELVKKHIHMNRRRNSVMTQITLDDDFNVPDSMDDVEQMILDSGEIQIETVKNLGGRVTVGGKLNFRILYRRPDGQLMTLAGSIPFEEQINVPELEETDYVQAGGELDDLHVGLINSRKLNVKALVTLTVQAETIFDVEAAADVTYDGDVETLKREITAAAIAVRRKDTFRVRENLTLSANKPDIDHLLWQDIRLRGVDTKPLDGRIHIDGELMVFAVYSGEDGQMPVQCLEESIPFSGEVELAESLEGMIPFITVRLVHKDLEVSPDADGEMRELTADAVMELDIRLYEEQQTELLSDLYALEGLDLILNHIERACDDPDALTEKNYMQIAAYYGGLAITASGTTAVHALSYPLGGKYHIAHGVSNAMLLVPVMRFNESACRARLAAVYDRCCHEQIRLRGEEEKSGWVIRRMADIVRHLDIPTSLKEFGITEDDLEDLVTAGMEVRRLLDNNVRPVTAEDARTLYQSIL